jgi:hypothetical protein
MARKQAILDTSGVCRMTAIPVASLDTSEQKPEKRVQANLDPSVAADRALSKSTVHVANPSNIHIGVVMRFSATWVASSAQDRRQYRLYCDICAGVVMLVSSQPK